MAVGSYVEGDDVHRFRQLMAQAAAHQPGEPAATLVWVGGDIADDGDPLLFGTDVYSADGHEPVVDP